VTWVVWNLVSVRLETVLESVQDRCMVCAKRIVCSEIIWTHRMVLLADKAQVDACFILFGDSANLDQRKVRGLQQTYHRLKNRFGCT
jgi:hypothetical protein